MTHDDLCERLESSINTLLGAFVRYKAISHVVQGPRDQGVDVLLKLRNRDDEPEKYVAFQLKSYAEIDNPENKVSKDLKSGYFDATSHYDFGLQRYYILLCGDHKKHEKRISALTKEFSKKPKATVLDARDLWTFFEMQEEDIEALVDRYLSEDDAVRSKALSEVSGLRRDEIYILLVCLCNIFAHGESTLKPRFLHEDADLVGLRSRVGSGTFQRMLEKIEYAFDVDDRTGVARVRSELFKGIRALYYDLQVRYEEQPPQLLRHLHSFLSL